MSDIQPADPKARRRTIIWVLIMSAVFLLLIWWLNENIKSIESWIAHPGEGVERAKLAIIVLVVSGASILLGIAGYVYKLSNSIISSERYPPPDLKVVRDTRIRRGEAACRIAKILKSYTVIVLMIIVTLIIIGWRIIQTMNDIAG